MPVLMLRRARFILLMFCSLAASASHAQVERFVADVHYRVLPPAPELRELQGSDAQPRVTEIFWYGCPSCYALDPLLESWVAQQGDAIEFARMPAVWNAITRQHARVFHAGHALGMHATLHTPVFDSIHQQRQYLTDESSVAALFANHGVTAEQFERAFNSFAMDTTLRRAEALTQALKLPGVPAMVVDGKYLVSGNDHVRGHTAMLEVVEFLLRK